LNRQIDLEILRKEFRNFSIFLGMPVKYLMSKDVVIIDVNDSMYNDMNLLKEHNIHIPLVMKKDSVVPYLQSK
jgi:CBS domain-containing protein